jgi:hypothetical protein
MILHRLDPPARAARTKSISFSDRAICRTMRHAVGHSKSAITTTIVKMLGPSTATNSRISIREGNDKNTSTIRMMKVSTHPPITPARRPSSVPRPAAEMAAATPTVSDTLAP